MTILTHPGRRERAGGMMWLRPAAAGFAVLATLLVATPAGAGWQHYLGSTSGLPNDGVQSVREARDGSLLFGTQSGAALYDGLRWTTYVDSLPAKIVNDCLQDRAGNLWFALQGAGVVRFDGSHWSRFSVAGGFLPSDYVACALEDHRGDLWFGTQQGLVRYVPGSGSWTTYTASAGGLVFPYAWRLLEDDARQLWIATPSGVSCLDSTRATWTTYRTNSAALAVDSVLALGSDPAGGVWFGTAFGAWRLHAGAWSHYDVGDGLPSHEVMAFARDGIGHLWVGGFAGVAAWDGRTFRPDGQTGPDSLGRVQAMAVDHAGALWVATQKHGVERWDGTTWRYYEASAPGPCAAQSAPSAPTFPVLPSNCISALLQDARGDLWVGTNGGGTARLGRAGASWGTLHRAAGVPVSDSLAAIAADSSGAVWFGSAAAGVARLDSTKVPAWTLFTAATGLASDSVRTIAVDSRGDVWVGTTNGASRWHAGAWSNWLRGGVQGFPVEVDQFVEDATGRMWLRTMQGLYSIDPARTQLTAWTTTDGLPDDEVDLMLRARDGAMWFGTPSGVARYAAGGWTVQGGFANRFDNAITALAEDPAGRIWVGTNLTAAYWDGAWSTFPLNSVPATTPVTGFCFDASGTVWLETSEGLARWNGEAWRPYGNGDGFAIGASRMFVQDSQGHIWFASGDASAAGLSEHVPDRTAPHTIFISKPPALSALRNVAFTFGAGFGESAELKFSTAWDGGPWSAWTTDNTWSRAGVADGTHTLSVRARDWVGNVDSTAATWRFEIDATAPAAVLSYPAYGQPVRGRVAILGTSSDPRFASWTLQARPDGVTNWTDARVRTLAGSARSVAADTLVTWNTVGLDEGPWDLRLSVADTLGLVGTAQVSVIVDNLPPFVDVTSPVRIVAKDGGEVFTTLSQVHLYFAPQAFDADAVVSVDSLLAGQASDTLPGGQVRRSSAWSIGWTGGNLVRPGVLELRPDAGGGPLAVFRSDSTGGWTPLGGTPTNGRLALALALPGRYAVFTGAGAAAGRGRISGARATPRAFSPTGRYASRDAAVTFTLASPGSVAVDVYNRAGRLVRELADHWPGVSGENVVRWDGRDEHGDVVPSGLYLVVVRALGDSSTLTLAVVP